MKRARAAFVNEEMTLDDFVFLMIFLSFSITIMLGGRFLKLRNYSFLLISVCFFAIITMIFLHSTDSVEPSDGWAHYTILAIAQFGVLALGFKLWFAINYHNLTRPLRVLLHVAAHGTLVFAIVASYWLKTVHPVLSFILYPLSSLSVALISESIEGSITVRSEQSNTEQLTRKKASTS